MNNHRNKSLLVALTAAVFTNSLIFGFSPSSEGRKITENARFSDRHIRCVTMRRDSSLGDDNFLENEKNGDFEEIEVPNRKEIMMQFLSGPDTSTQWTLPNNFEMFLNQCTIQSFLFLLKSLRDPQTVMWLEEFTQPDGRVADTKQLSFQREVQTAGSFSSKLLVYHGLAALNTTLFPTWDSYFATLLEQPVQSFVVESDLPHVPDYNLDIEPARLCSRIMSVREQIAREFVKDLEAISGMGWRMLDSYWEEVRSRGATNKDSQESRADEIARQRRQQNFLFLELNPDEESDYQPSPLRKGNFDLLCNLVTQESIHRILNVEPGNDFLRRFYLDRIHYFVGNQRYGRADMFLKEMLWDVPTMQEAPDGTVLLTDPTSLTEKIVQMREEVAMEWKSLAKAVPDKHLIIRRLQLDLMFGQTTNNNSDDSGRMQ